MSTPKKLNTVEIAEQLMTPVANRLGLEIWDVEFKKEGNQWYLRYFLDKDGGINIDDCEAASREISELLDKEDPIKQSYVLEVGSPGIERILKKDSHFQQYMGSEILVRLIRPVDGVRDFVGVLTAKNGNTITLELEEDIEMTFELKEAAYVKLHVVF